MAENLLGEMIALRLETVLVGDECDRVLNAVWGDPADCAADHKDLVLRARILNFSRFRSRHSVTCFITAELFLSC